MRARPACRRGPLLQDGGSGGDPAGAQTQGGLGPHGGGGRPGRVVVGRGRLGGGGLALVAIVVRDLGIVARPRLGSLRRRLSLRQSGLAGATLGGHRGPVVRSAKGGVGAGCLSLRRHQHLSGKRAERLRRLRLQPRSQVGQAADRHRPLVRRRRTPAVDRAVRRQYVGREDGLVTAAQGGGPFRGRTGDLRRRPRYDQGAATRRTGHRQLPLHHGHHQGSDRRPDRGGRVAHGPVRGDLGRGRRQGRRALFGATQSGPRQGIGGLTAGQTSDASNGRAGGRQILERASESGGEDTGLQAQPTSKDVTHRQVRSRGTLRGLDRRPGRVD